MQEGAAPLHPPPLQLVNVEPAVGAAVRVTVLPVTKSAAQTVPQEIPLGSLLTVPVPVPALITVRRLVLTAVINRAVTVALPVTVQAPVPEQSPLHPANDEPGDAAAFRATDVPASNCAD